jgi:hypothetical protein
VGLKLFRFRATSVLTVEPHFRYWNLWNDGANEPNEDEGFAHGEGDIIGCYGGSYGAPQELKVAPG